MSSVVEIRSIEQLAPFRKEWARLLKATPEASFFQSLDWLECYWRHFGESQQLRVLVVEDRQEVIGILPLVVRQETTRAGRLRFLTYPLDHWGSFYGPIASRPDEALSTGLQHLASTGLDADVLELRWVGNHGEECDRAEEQLTAAGFAPHRSQLDPTSVIDLSGSWESYLASRTGKWRNNFRRWARQLEKLGEVTHVRHRPEADPNADPRWDLYEECLRIAACSWQGSSSTGTTLTHENIVAFLKDAHLSAVRCGCLDMNLLCLNGQAVAFAYNYAYAGNLFSLRIGYDPSIPCKGAGGLLYGKIIEDSFRRGDWRYDLGPRHLECKRSLITDVLPIYRTTSVKSWSAGANLLRLKRLWDSRAADTAVNRQ